MGNFLEGQNGQMMITFVIWAVLLGGLYFVMLRPQSKKRKEEEEMRKNLQIGDEITTIGGIVGRVVSIKDHTDSIVIETGIDRNKVLLKKWAISSCNPSKKEEE